MQNEWEAKREEHKWIWYIFIVERQLLSKDISLLIRTQHKHTRISSDLTEHDRSSFWYILLILFSHCSGFDPLCRIAYTYIELLVLLMGSWVGAYIRFVRRIGFLSWSILSSHPCVCVRALAIDIGQISRQSLRKSDTTCIVTESLPAFPHFSFGNSSFKNILVNKLI